MADQINGTDFIAVLGELDPDQNEIEDCKRPDSNGPTYKKRGTDIKPCKLVSRKDYADWSTAKTAAQNAANLTGDSIVFQQASVNTTCIVLNVRLLRRVGMVKNAGGSSPTSTVLQDLEWLVRPLV